MKQNRRGDSVRVIGLTGGIASGKSTASKILADLGAKIIDADQISRDIVVPGSAALKEIQEVFGDSVIDDSGCLIRSAVAKMVFNDQEMLKKLNAITHPRIITEIQKRLEALKQEREPVILDAALLIELQLNSMVDEIWLVWVTHEKQLERLVEREKMKIEDGAKIINAQMPLEEKKQKADVCIDNNGTFEDLKTQLIALWQEQKE